MTTQNKNAPAAIDFANMNVEQLRAELAKTQAENAKLAQEKAEGKKAGTFSIKTAAIGQDKDGKAVGGNVSLYGLGRFPFTFYGSQVVVVFDPSNALAVLEHTLAHIAELRVKGDTQAEVDNARQVLRTKLTAQIAAYKNMAK